MDMTDQNVVTVPLYIDVYDDYNALVNKTTYGSRRIDNFYFNFTDIKVISEDGDAKTAVAERFRAYIDYYFTAGTGNYGYYEDLWYDADTSYPLSISPVSTANMRAHTTP